MSIACFVAGPYNATYNAIALAGRTSSGIYPLSLTSEGYTLSFDAKAELIQNSDQFGDSILDGIYRGGNCYCDFESKTFIQGSMSPFWPYHNLGVMMTTALPVGRQMSSSASALVMTAVANTPAAVGQDAGQGAGQAYTNTTATPPSLSGPMAIGTLTAPVAVLPPDANQKLLFTSKLRTVPIRLLLLPSLLAVSGNYIGWFQTT